MTTAQEQATPVAGRVPMWLAAVLPLLALISLVAVLAFGNPLALFRGNLPPVERIAFDRIRVTPTGFETILINDGPQDVTVAQVQVDDAYWQFEMTPGPTIPRFGRATLRIPFPWVEPDPYVIRLVTQTGLTFEETLEVATLTPTPGAREFLAYGLLGVYVGIIPVGLGLLWFPMMRRMGRKWLGAILALTVGLLVFLLVDTLLEAVEVASTLPGIFQGIPLILFSALLTWLALLAIGSSRRDLAVTDPSRQRLYVAILIALGIGLHNLGEGLAIGAAFALGEAALGSFLVIGFTLHNVTEGIGIAAPLTADRPRWTTFAGLTLLAGAPAILGTWIGGFAYSPLLATVFLGIGVGAIWQVIVEVVNLLRGYARREEAQVASWLNVGGFLAGLAIMYVTAFLVKV